jgi:hypothetical protein
MFLWFKFFKIPNLQVLLGLNKNQVFQFEIKLASF